MAGATTFHGKRNGRNVSEFLHQFQHYHRGSMKDGHPERPLGNLKDGRPFINEDERNAAHRYILLNCTEILPFVGKVDEEVLSKYPSISDEALGRMRDENFPKWLMRDYVIAAHNIGEENIRYIAQGPSRSVRTYKGYYVNGFKFHTTQYGEHKSTMNNGVCVLGSSWSENEVDYYGLLEEVSGELEYFGVGNKVVLFKCQWYDILTEGGAGIYPRFGVVEINVRRALNTNNPFILAQQAHQVYQTTFPIGGLYAKQKLGVE